MRQRKKPAEKRFSGLSGLVATGAEVEEPFQTLVKSLHCPNCDLAFTDFALAWGAAWREGRRDLLFEQGCLDGERDGPNKLQCELCGQRSWLNCFSRSVSSAERSTATPGTGPQSADR